MNEQQLGLLLKYRNANWPSMPVTKELIEVFRLECSALDFDETLRVLRSEFATHDFPPTPMQVRSAVIRAGLPPAPDIDVLIGEVQRIVSAYGRYALASKGLAVLAEGEDPPLDHNGVALPHTRMAAAAEFVRRRGADDLCSAPAGDATDSQQASAFATWRAQAREDLKVIVAHVQEAQVEQRMYELERGDGQRALDGGGDDDA